MALSPEMMQRYSEAGTLGGRNAYNRKIAALAAETDLECYNRLLGGESPDAIAKDFGLSPGTIRNRARTHLHRNPDAKRPPPTPYMLEQRDQKKETAAIDAKAYALRKAGKTLQEVATEFGVTRERIRQRIYRYQRRTAEGETS